MSELLKESVLEETSPEDDGNSRGLKKEMTWKDAFWFATGVPALVLFSIGAIAATVGGLSWLVWTLSISIGFIQSFVYAEIAGLYPKKSGGASVYGAMAWVKYSKFLSAMSIWSNWIAWTPVLALGTKLASGFVLTTFFPNAAITTWGITLLNLSFIRPDLTVRFDFSFVLALAFLAAVFFIQNLGAVNAARIQRILAVVALLPLLIVGIVPLITNGINVENITPSLPTGVSWDAAGWTLLFGGLFLAAWSTYAFETAICYTSEFKNPKKDTYKAIIFSGLLCLLVFTLVPFSFQNFFGPDGLLDPGIESGMGVGSAMAMMVGGGLLIETILVLLLILSTVLSIMTSMGGSSRTIYQGSVDGWFPKFISRVNRNGAPTGAMWTNLGFNVILLSLSDYTFILAISNVNYIIFNFFNLNAGWIHRMDRPNWARPLKIPTWLLSINVVLAFVNIAFLGLGALVWGTGTLISGLLVALIAIPLFGYRHFFRDKGKFPEPMQNDYEEEGFVKKAGILPYIAVAAAIVLIIITSQLSVYSL
ncbi:APC family permease [Oceanobacillus polygoni]|uniref:Amino acid transporter n=1 Tax=Oceanobacillus polygoni TaxID=1235259 RepID=A0A9X0YWK3_9BACI|nr:APC family permease [Oceanobacillus polygoni]MBP2078449.1 amino acid transporter [Oceanobacillus polygoni]